MDRESKRLIALVVALLVIIAIGWTLLSGRDDRASQAELELLPTLMPEPAEPAPPTKNPEKPTVTPPPVNPATPTKAKAPTGNSLSGPKALAAFNLGLQELDSGQYIQARRAFADALNSETLQADLVGQARAKLRLIADSTIFSEVAWHGDPFTFKQMFGFGDVLEGKKGLIRKHELRVPSQTIVRINRLQSANSFQAGREYKLIRGPFRAVVRKSLFVMDIYLGDIFVRRISVGLGSPKSPTPTGQFRLALGGKTTKSSYRPPLGSDLGNRMIYPGDPKYPLDAKGHYMKLEGMPDTPSANVTIDSGYAIHGTNNPSSIGRTDSLGCVRLGDDDIAWLYSLLYEHWSHVDIVP